MGRYISMAAAKRALICIVMLCGLLAAMARVGGLPYLELPADGALVKAYYLQGAGAAIKLHKSMQNFPFLYEDLKAVALAYFDYQEYSDAYMLFLRLEKQRPSDAIVRAHRIFLSNVEAKAAPKLKAEFPNTTEARIRLLLGISELRAHAFESAKLFLNIDTSFLDVPDLLPYLLYKAELLYTIGDKYEAARVLIESLYSYPFYRPFYMLRARIFVEGGVPDGAFEDLEIAKALGADEYAVAYWTGRAHKQKGSFAEAIPYFTTAIKMKPALPHVWLERGDCYRYTNEKAKAIEDYREAFNRDPTLTVALVNMAVLNFDLGEMQVSRQLFDEAIETNPNFSSAYVERGNYHAACSMIEEAEADYLKAYELVPNDPYPLYRLASMFLNFADTDNAFKYAAEVVNKFPEYAPIKIVLGDISRLNEDFTTAIEFYRSAFESDPKNNVAARNLAAMLLEIRDFRGANEMARKALSIWQDDLPARYTLGLSELARGETDKAAVTFTGIINLDEGYAPAYYGLSLCAFARSNMNEGVMHIENAIRWNPSPQFVSFRAMIGLFEPAYSMGKEEEIFELLGSRDEQLRISFFVAALSKDFEAAKAKATELASLENTELQWLGQLLVEEIESGEPLSRPPGLKPPKRTLACLALALLYYARNERDACKNMLTFNVRSIDYLTPDFYLSSVFQTRLLLERPERKPAPVED